MSNRGARWQRGTLQRRGDQWILRIRQDFTGEDGITSRRERTLVVANSSDVRTRTHARTLADAMVDRLTGRDLTPGTSIGAAEYCRRYMAEHVVSKKPASRSTINGRIRKHILPAVARLRMEQVSTRTAQKLVATMLEAGLHSTTIRDTVRTLSTITKRAKADGIACQVLDCRTVSMPAKGEVDVERQVFTVEEVAQLVTHGSYPWRLAYAIQATCGLRCGEVLGLAWRDFEAETVNVRRAVVKGRVGSVKTKSSAARLAVAAVAAQMLAEHRARWVSNDRGLLFATRNKSPVHDSWYRKKLHEDCQRLGIPKRGTHAFRHFAATQLLRQGQSTAAVRDHLRHSNVAITNTYAHTVQGDLAKGAELLGNLILASAQAPAQVVDVCGSGP